jgi:beta-mannanase
MMIGRQPLLDLNYYNWASDDWTTDPNVAADFAAARIPLVNWEPYDNSSAGMVNFDDIVSGKYDSYIQKYATAAKAFGKTFFLDFAAEMNADEAWTNHDAAKYIAGWHHVHDIFTTAGATNVVWAWCPNVTDSDGTNNATMSYYPGDTYVDWVGVDGYNWGTSQPGFGWQTFQQVFQDIYPLLAAKNKPILIGEMASDEVGGSKAQWITDIVPTLKTSFPMIKAFVWFDVKKERSWQLNSSASSLTAYSQMAKDPYMNP